MSKILLVDDEQSVLDAMKILLGTEGHVITVCCDSGKAAELVRDGAFDLMITDIRMTPLDGMELIKLAHEHNPNMPCIVVSAYSSDSTEQQGFDAGCIAYIKKPFKIQEVLDAVHKALASAKK